MDKPFYNFWSNNRKSPNFLESKTEWKLQYFICTKQQLLSQKQQIFDNQKYLNYK